VALPPFAGDDAYRRALDEVVLPVARAFSPQAIVTQCGVDHHHADPLAHLLTTMSLYPELWRRLRELADEACGGRWVALGGGGYEPCTAPPRAWAALAAEMAGASVEGPVPERWRRLARKAGCADPARGWLEDAGPPPDEERDRRAAAGVEAAIVQSRIALARFWPLAA
jgi:acetoin utilization protein AcuC